MCITAVCVGQRAAIDLRGSACLAHQPASSPAHSSFFWNFNLPQRQKEKSNYRLTKEAAATIPSFVSPLMKLSAFNCESRLIETGFKKVDNFTGTD